MNFLKSIFEAAALEWFHLRQGYGGQVGTLRFASCGKLRRAWLDYSVGHGALFAKRRRAKPHLASGEPAAKPANQDL
jgi:hypothetical protein